VTEPSILPPPPPPVHDELELLLRLGDDRLVLGHRLSEWCGHAPILEEDIALANVALDLLGQATLFLRRAGEVEGHGRDEDALAYWREAVEFRNCLLVEQPNGDFGFTITRQFLFDVYAVVTLDTMMRSASPELGALAAKSLKEARYHVRHSAEWILKLGDGTEESHRRVQRAIDELWRFTPELFAADDVAARLAASGAGPDLPALRETWETQVLDVLRRATLTVPEGASHSPHLRGGRDGMHSEHLGHLLAELQIVARSHPGASW
jgi:ring-1,2-phenylacetyl-CoA epoxidase subunit PaaC